MKDCGDKPQITHAAGTTAKEATQARSGESVTALIKSAPASSSSSDDEATASGGPLAAVGRSARSMGDDCCSTKESEIGALGAHADIKRVLQIVLVINLVMFVAEFTAGV